MKINKLRYVIFASLFTLTASFGSSPLTMYKAHAADSSAEAQAESIVNSMTLEEKLGQMIMPDFRYWGKDSQGKNIPFTSMNEQVAGIIKKYHLGGIILFKENVPGTAQTTRLVYDLQKAAKTPLMITIDQEGGLVTRLQTGTNMPGNMALGAADNVKITEKVGKAIGEELKALGINVNFAPVLDVNVNPDNPVIGIRSFGGFPDLVAKQGSAFIKGLQSTGVAATAKHFPGHGDTANDTHLGVSVVDHSLEELHSIDLVPFKKAIVDGIDMIMTAHVTVPAIDNDKAISKKDGKEVGIPATLSKKILTELLREELGFKGVIVTDAMNMKAISDHFGKTEAVIKTINSGTDIVLMPVSVWNSSAEAELEIMFNTLINSVKDGTIPESRITESAKRIITIKIKRGIIGSQDARTIEEIISEAEKTLGSKDHKRIERIAAEKAMTLIRNENKTLPFKLKKNNKLLIIGYGKSRVDLMTLALKDIMKETGKKIEYSTLDYSSFGPDIPENFKKAIDESDNIILGTLNLKVIPGKESLASKPDRLAKAITEYAAEKNKPLVVMAYRNPYDGVYLPDAKAVLAVYGPTGYDITSGSNASLPINIPVGMRTIFGLVKPKGKLPVAMPTIN